MAHAAATASSPLMSEIRLTTAESAEEFESVVRLYRAKIFRFVLASLRDRDAAETITQDCFFKAFKARDRFRNECSMSTWLMQIAVNLVRDHVRNRRLQFWRKTQSAPDISDVMASRSDDRERSPEVQVLLKERVAAVWDAAAKLPERQRTVFLLRFVEDMELREIAAATNLQEGTVKVHLFRALHAVRERMEASQ